MHTVQSEGASGRTWYKTIRDRDKDIKVYYTIIDWLGGVYLVLLTS